VTAEQLARCRFATKLSPQDILFGAFYAAAKLIPLPALAAELASDSRVSQMPIVDKGFASVRKIGNGLYATISDPSRGGTTYCNGGFLVGKDSALLIETKSGGAALQMETLRTVSFRTVEGRAGYAHHFDTPGQRVLQSGQQRTLWAHAFSSTTNCRSYAPLQGADKPQLLGL